MDCDQTYDLLLEASATGCKSLLERDMLEIALLWDIWNNVGGDGEIDCSDASVLIAEAMAVGCRSPWERDLVEIALLYSVTL